VGYGMSDKEIENRFHAFIKLLFEDLVKSEVKSILLST